MARPLLRLAPIAAVMLIAATLLLWRLGAVYLWQDEAATAVLAERMLRYGRPLAYDGRNVITMDSFADEDPSTIGQRTGSDEAALRYLVARGDFRADTTWVGHPWGQFVVAAISLGVLGHGTAEARLPFALAALATVLLLHQLSRRALEDRALAVLAAALLVGNAFWILHSRQCRYYALSSLSLVLSTMAYLRWQRGDRWGAPLFVAAGWLFFQCDYGTFFPAMAVFGVLALAAGWPRVGRTLAVFAVLGATTAPIAVYYGLHARLRNATWSPGDRFLANLYNVNQFLIAVPVLALACWFLWLRRRELGDEARLLLQASVGIIGAILAWVPAVAPASFHRYVVGLTPLAALLTAWTIAQVAVAMSAGKARLRAGVVAAATLVVAVTGLASAPVAAALTGLRWPFRAVERPEILAALREVFVPRPDPNRMTVEAVAARLRPGDEILVNYEDIPFMFYTGARIRGGIAAFRAEDHQGEPPRFLVLRRSVAFVHWPVFRREVARYRWRGIGTGAPDIPFGNFPDPTWVPLRPARDEVIVAERVP